MNLKCILHHLIKNSESYRQRMAKFQLQNHQIDPLKSKMSIYLVIPSSEWCQLTCMVLYVWFEEYIMHFRQFRFKFRVWRAKNGEVSAENHQNDPPEKTKIPLFPYIYFYMAENDLYGHISLVWRKWNTLPSISMEISSLKWEKFQL